MERVKRDQRPPFHAPGAGVLLCPALARGRGIATEAMAAIFAWTDAHLDAPSIRCIIAPDNGGSIKVAEKLGFAALAEVDFHGAPTRIFDRPCQR